MKMIKVWLTILFVFSPILVLADLESGVKDLAKQISNNMKENNKKKIAIIEFSNLNDEVTQLGQFLSEELITQLFIADPGKFEVVERRQLLKVLNEQELGTSGLLDADAMGTVGKILGVDAIVTGSITDLGNDIKINARLIAIDTAKIFAVATTTMPKVGTVVNLMEKKAPNESGATNKTTVVSKREGNLPSSNKHGQTIDANGYTFNLLSCIKNSDKVKCKFNITNNEKENSLLLYGTQGTHSSRLFDPKGETYNANKVELAGVSASPEYVQTTLPSGIPVSAAVSFIGIPDHVDVINMIDISATVNYMPFKAQFRNVAISK